MTDMHRGTYIGKRVGDPPADQAEHFWMSDSTPVRRMWRVLRRADRGRALMTGRPGRRETVNFFILT
jgi:hypothetical protein